MSSLVRFVTPRFQVPARNIRRHDIPLDMGSLVPNMAHAEACEEFECLDALVSAAHDAIDATVPK